jgi:predicted DNA-binding protein (UPF0251 family)
MLIFIFIGSLINNMSKDEKSKDKKVDSSNMKTSCPRCITRMGIRPGRRGRGYRGGHVWRRRHMTGGPGRPFGRLHLSHDPGSKKFMPHPTGKREPIELTYPEYEVLHLADLEGFTQEKVAKQMKTSRGTVWRLLSSARKKVATALVESRPLLISPKGKIEKA